MNLQIWSLEGFRRLFSIPLYCVAMFRVKPSMNTININEAGLKQQLRLILILKECARAGELIRKLSFRTASVDIVVIL